MKVLVSGASGLVGSALIPVLEDAGHETLRLVRHPVRDPGAEMQWDPYAGSFDSGELPPFDAIIHLSGENIAGRWTSAKKRNIYDSRIRTTTFLAECMERMDQPPKVWLCASAIGYYGDQGDTILTESAEPGATFLASVCEDWERAAAQVTNKGVRVVNMRFGVVLDQDDGSLPLMMMPIKMGVGGVIGDGKQYFSWITLDDLVNAIVFALDNDSLDGPVNFVAPNPVTNHELTKTLGKVLNRPTVLPAPKFALRLLLGQMADELLLPSTRVVPEKLTEAGFEFEHPEIGEALKALLKN
jgi:uncharacterized protein